MKKHEIVEFLVSCTNRTQLVERTIELEEEKEGAEVMNDKYNKVGYTIEIKGFVDVFEDNFKDGEGRHVNCWNIDDFKFEVDSLNNKEEIQKQIMKHVSSHLFNECTAQGVLCDFIDNRFTVGQTVNVNNYEPTSYEREQWENGKINLYAQYIDFMVYINGKEVDEKDMYKIVGV